MSIESCRLFNDEQNQGDGEECDQNEGVEETIEKQCIVIGNNTCVCVEREREREREREKERGGGMKCVHVAL